MELGRSRPKNFYGLGQERPKRAGLGQHRAGPAIDNPAGGRIIFLPTARLLHATCRRRKMQAKKTKGKTQGKSCVPGVEEAVAGGVARGRRLRAAALRLFPSVRFALSLSSLLLVSVLFFLFCFRFGFSIPFSLSLACSLSLRSPPLSLCFLKKNPSLLSPSVSPFIEKKHGAGTLFLVRLQSRLAGRFFRWWWGQGERGGKLLKTVSFFCCRFGGEKRKRNSAVQNGTVRSFFFYV